MASVFSHIVQKRLSQENENVATEALAYILDTSEAAREGMNRLLRGIVPDLPPLRFETQLAEGTVRPDMRGFADAETRVFVENKFWAGLTDHQPISYLKHLAAYARPTATVLLVIAPAKREHILVRDLTERLRGDGDPVTERGAFAGISWSVATQRGPVLALTSWATVLSALEHAAVDDPRARGDLAQLGALCDAADIDAFTPISSQDTSDQRLPALITQLASIVQETVELGVTERVLSVTKLNPQANWRRIGRYAKLSGDHGPGVWFGIHFRLWKSHGVTPFGLKFTATGFGRAQEVWPLIEPWAVRTGALAIKDGRDVAVALPIRHGEDKAGVIRGLLDELKAITDVLAKLRPSSDSELPTDGDDAA